MGRPLSPDEDTMTAIHLDLAGNTTVVAIIFKFGNPRTTVHGNIERAERRIQ